MTSSYIQAICYIRVRWLYFLSNNAPDALVHCQKYHHFRGTFNPFWSVPYVASSGNLFAFTLANLCIDSTVHFRLPSIFCKQLSYVCSHMLLVRSKIPAGYPGESCELTFWFVWNSSSLTRQRTFNYCASNSIMGWNNVSRAFLISNSLVPSLLCWDFARIPAARPPVLRRVGKVLPYVTCFITDPVFSFHSINGWRIVEWFL